jgi:hypothetical protein
MKAGPPPPCLSSIQTAEREKSLASVSRFPTFLNSMAVEGRNLPANRYCCGQDGRAPLSKDEALRRLQKFSATFTKFFPSRG